VWSADAIRFVKAVVAVEYESSEKLHRQHSTNGQRLCCTVRVKKEGLAERERERAFIKKRVDVVL